jgi:hypothetical protein
MESKYYFVMAIEVDTCGQSDELSLEEVNNRIIGYSSEFELCTFDIEKACSDENYQEAIWFGWEESWEFKPATFALLKKFELTKYLIGSRKRMHLSEPIEPITDLDATD